jgi:signal transduction histidine kinase
MRIARSSEGRRAVVEPAGIAFVTALTIVGAVVEAHPRHHYAGLHLGAAPPPAAYLLLAAAALGLGARRRYPIAVFLLSVVAAVTWAGLGQIDGAALVPVVVATYAMTLDGSRRAAAVVGVAGALGIWVTEGLLGPFGWLGGPNATMWPELVSAAALGAYVAARRESAAVRREREAQAEQSRQGETRRQMSAERVRIARELHDVVAHSMAMINVQATAASYLLADDPDRVAAALQEIRRASKDGLRELRTILDVLRVGHLDDPAVPTPDLQAIEALGLAATAAGATTTVHSDDGLDSVAPEVALAAYRIVQESLTNVVRHAGGATTAVELRLGSGELVVEVVDHGGRRGTGFGEGSGTGLTGMRERATALGGELEAGPHGADGFRVVARLPIGLEGSDTGTGAPEPLSSAVMRAGSAATAAAAAEDLADHLLGRQ